MPGAPHAIGATAAATKLRRSLLITPGDRPERIAKAATLAADGVVLDLEDGVGPAHKDAARGHIAAALRGSSPGRPERIVRINAIGTAASQSDLEALAPVLPHIDALMVPKVERADQLHALATWLDENEGERQGNAAIDIVATIETPRGLFNALAIADASPRTSALFFGSGDYTAATGSAVSERALAVPRALIVAAAAAAGIAAIDAAYFADVKNAEATQADARIAAKMGFTGKLLFHPSQIAPVNAVFTPTATEVARARRIVEAYRDAQGRGEGTAYVDGDFIAVDIVVMAERLLARAVATGVGTS